MKLLQYLGKNKDLKIVLLVVLSFFLLRLPSLIEPYWYGDEAIYEVIGMALNQGRLLYTEIWDNKPPLLYVIYALAHADQFTVRLYALMAGLLSAVFFYCLAQKLFASAKLTNFVTVLYVLLFATPFLEGNIANSENFMLFPIIAAGYLIYDLADDGHKKRLVNKNKVFFGAGILLGVAFLLKIVAVFDFAAFLVFWVMVNTINKQLIKNLFFYTLGFLLPIVLTLAYFVLHGNIIDFIQAVIWGNVTYVNYANKFIVGQGLLIIKLALLLLAVTFIFIKRKSIPKHVLFIFIWFSFSVFNALFSGRIWTHYLLVLVPSAALLIGLLFDKKAAKMKLATIGLCVALFYITVIQFKIGLGRIDGSVRDYQNFFQYIGGSKNEQEYQAYFDKKTPRDYAVAQFIKNKTKPQDNIFVWGNNPQIYVLSNKLPPGKFTVAYHINANDKTREETAKDIDRVKPKYVIILQEQSEYPFSLKGFRSKYSLEKADIYEKIF